VRPSIKTQQHAHAQKKLKRSDQAAFSGALGVVAALGLLWLGYESDWRSRVRPPIPPFSAALDLAAALVFLLRIGELFLVEVGRNPEPLLSAALGMAAALLREINILFSNMLGQITAVSVFFGESARVGDIYL
jgi:hypothetical protein